MDQFPLFSSGLDLATLVVNSNLLHHSWGAILATYEGANLNEQQSLPFPVKYKVYQQSNLTIIAFITSPLRTIHHLEEGKELVSSTAFDYSFLFKFLCTKDNSSFSIQKAAIASFAHFYNELLNLKPQYGNAYPLIITGHSLGGSIASLFTLWLLENINGPDAKRPLCITFGAPLLGDDGLQKAIEEHSTWNSCFLHVAANQDPVPRFFISPHNPHPNNPPSHSIVYKPFGTYLLCSEMGSTCLEDPEAISELLVSMGLESTRTLQPNEELPIVNYGQIVECLKSRVLCKGTSLFGKLIRNSLAGISLQLEAIGIVRTQQQQQNSNLNNLITKMEKREQACILKKRQAFDPSKKLNEIKKNMVQLEWYKKECKKKQIGYYDTYKRKGTPSDQEVVRFKAFLTKYWKKMVEEAEQKPQKEGAAFQTRWLFGGTNYRRMVEPLDIAEYYSETGRRDYKTNGRSQHYIKLEQWLAEALAEVPNSADSSVDLKKQNVEAILTEDSCFWAYVEDALISCRLLKNGDSSTDERELWENLIKFEEYVLEMIKNYAVSPEIFLEKSSFMQWWREYEGITGPTYNSRLGEIMRNGRYSQYAGGLLVLT